MQWRPGREEPSDAIACTTDRHQFGRRPHLEACLGGSPADLAVHMANRIKRPLGDAFGLTVFGVNLTRLRPGAWSMPHHQHKRQDEFIYVLDGTPVLITEASSFTERSSHSQPNVHRWRLICRTRGRGANRGERSRWRPWLI